MMAYVNAEIKTTRKIIYQHVNTRSSVYWSSHDLEILISILALKILYQIGLVMSASYISAFELMLAIEVSLRD